METIKLNNISSDIISIDINDKKYYIDCTNEKLYNSLPISKETELRNKKIIKDIQTKILKFISEKRSEINNIQNVLRTLETYYSKLDFGDIDWIPPYILNDILENFPQKHIGYDYLNCCFQEFKYAVIVREKSDGSYDIHNADSEKELKQYIESNHYDIKAIYNNKTKKEIAFKIKATLIKE